MSALTDAQVELAAFLVAAGVQADPISPVVPLNLVGGAAFVWAADPWVSQLDEEGTFCRTRSVGLLVDFVARTVELTQSQAWLADRVDELWVACAGGVPVQGDRIIPIRANQPNVVQAEKGVAFLVCRVEFSRFDLEN